MKKLMSVAMAAVLGLVVFGATQQAQAVPVDLELQLLVDVSGSVSDAEFGLQRGGYVNAFNSAAVQSAILAGQEGAIAVQLIYWASSNEQAIGVDWTLVDSAAAASSLATDIGNAARPFGGSTAPGSAIAYGTPLFDNNGFEGDRLVMDVSGDGSQNDGVSTSGARDAALAAGIDAINGVTIGGSQSLFDWYVANVQGGTDSFTLQADTFADFEEAIEDKLVREIIGGDVPEPVTAALSLMALTGLGLTATRRRRQD